MGARTADKGPRDPLSYTVVEDYVDVAAALMGQGRMNYNAKDS